MRFIRYIAQLDIFNDLGRKYLAFYGLIMMGFLFFKELGLNVWLTILVIAGMIIAFLILIWLDWRYIFPKKVEKLSRNNPITMEILERLKSIESRL